MGLLVRRIESIVPRRAEGFGGKARGLAVLARAGFPVPAACALSTEAFDRFVAALLPEEDRPAALIGGAPDAERLASVRARILSATLPEPVEAAIRSAVRDLEREGATTLAVRSSSSREDRFHASAAGVHATVLAVRGEDAVLVAVKECYASLFTAEALSYLRATPLEPGQVLPPPSLGVVLQAMVPADVAGVLFTANPLTADASEVLVNASYGLGSLVVDGRVSPDTLRIDKATGAIRDRVVGDKAERAVLREGRVVIEPVPEADRTRTCIDGAQTAELHRLAKRIEAHFGDARDVEFAFRGGHLYVLQARPITTLAGRVRVSRTPKVPRDRSKIVWSNANVGEALPGVATPLTWSVLSNFSDLGFRRAFGSLGCTVPKDAELVGSFRGRIYLNLTEFVAICSQVPGLPPRTLLALGGGGEADRLERDVERRSSRGFLMRLPMTAARFVRENVAITQRVEQFEREFEAERARVSGVDLRILSAPALGATLRDVERLLDRTGAIMLTCYGNLLSTVVLQRTVLKLVAGDRAEALQRDLTTGLADLESAAPGLSLWHIAEMARVDLPARDVLLSRDPSTLRVSDLPAGPVRRALERFIEAYGHRGAREAEIAEPRWREDPTVLFVTLKLHLTRDRQGPGPLDVERRQRDVRAAADQELDGLVPAPARAAVRHLLALVQRFVRLRERLRGHVTEVLGIFRGVALESSRRIAVREPSAGPDAAFFLTLEELSAALVGRIDTVASLVRPRRAAYARDRSLPDPPDTFVGYPPLVEAPIGDASELHGLPASGGRVTGRARVLGSASDAATLEAGEILVAPYADVGWSPLFLVARGIVTDLGGPLSHAAIIAREYGVPAVMNVKTGTRVLHTGDLLEVDGDAGIVRVLPK